MCLTCWKALSDIWTLFSFASAQSLLVVLTVSPTKENYGLVNLFQKLMDTL